MEFREVIESRHAVRHFRDDPVPRESLGRVVSAARVAPSAYNEQPWRLFVLRGEGRRRLGGLIAQATIHLEEMIDTLGQDGVDEAAHWYASLGDAPVLVAIASPCSADGLVRLNRHLSVGAVLENLLLAAVDEGLSACPITYSHWVEGEIAELLELPKDWDVLTVVAIGLPTDRKTGSPRRREDDTVWLD